MEPYERTTPRPPILFLLVAFAALLAGPIYACTDKTDRGPRYCYENGIEIGILEATYKDGNGKWVHHDSWGWAERPTKGPDGNWHFVNRAHHDPVNVTIPGEMLLSYTPDSADKGRCK